MRAPTLLLLLSCAVAVPAASPAPDAARVYFIAPADGATVPATVRVVMGLAGMGVAPAGVEVANTGHHHLLIDTPLPPLDQHVPQDARHRHFGGGQTEAELTLSPGTHTLQLLLGDWSHTPHTPPVYSDVITVIVE